MANTLVGYYDDYEEARRTERDLLAAGFRPENVSVTSQSAEGARGANVQESWWDRFKASLGFESDEHRTYYESVAQRGGALVTVRAADEHTDTAAMILERHHPVNVDSNAPGAMSGANTGRNVRAAESETIPVAQEELVVGKRVVQRGGVRIHTHVKTEPVEQQVRLTEEKAFVERRPQDRPAKPGEAAFQERTIDVRETGEEAVAAKKARVVEEVQVGKRQTTQTETVRDTVRKTEVDVDRDDKPGRKR